MFAAIAAAIVGATISGAVTLIVGLALHRGQAAIAVNVDGRLEAALLKIDELQADVSALTGQPAPAPVAGQNVTKG